MSHFPADIVYDMGRPRRVLFADPTNKDDYADGLSLVSESEECVTEIIVR